MNVSQWSDLPLVLTSDQVAMVLQLNRRTITNMLDRGDLHGVKVGKEWRVSRAELVRFVEGGVAKAQGKTSSMVEAFPLLTEKGGVLVVQARPIEDLDDLIRREHDQRIADLIEQTAL